MEFNGNFKIFMASGTCRRNHDRYRIGTVDGLQWTRCRHLRHPWRASFKVEPQDQWWRLTFLLGLVLGGGAAYFWAPETFIDITENGTMQVLVAGLLVGLGTRIGSGCTSGHGVCGIGRLSVRSLVATLVFVGLGMLTVFFSGGLQ